MAVVASCRLANRGMREGELENSRGIWSRAVLAIATVVALALCMAAAGTSPANADTKWLCKPTLTKDPCHTSRTTTVIKANGSTSVKKFPITKRRPVDCFYVYPTVSGQQTANADKTIDPELKAIAAQQASRFGQVCKVYAPVYRQLTLVGIGGSSGEVGDEADPKIAFADVRDAFLEYLKKYNHGRGFILVGHSQGAAMLRELIKRQVDERPNVRKRMLAAYALGGNITVKKGSDVGGDFQNVRACHSDKQLGCVIAYSSFSSPPPEDALFGRAGTGPASDAGSDPATEKVLCTNPASLSGGTGKLYPYFSSAKFPGVLGALIDVVPDVPTAWGSYPDLYTGTCKNEGGAQWLQIDAPSNVGDPRPVGKQTIGPAWGLHLSDVNIAWGNLVSIAKAETKSYLKREAKSSR
jgi:hypothetical protein